MRVRQARLHASVRARRMRSIHGRKRVPLTLTSGASNAGCQAATAGQRARTRALACSARQGGNVGVQPELPQKLLVACDSLIALLFVR
jgi:hypothetical protein